MEEVGTRNEHVHIFIKCKKNFKPKFGNLCEIYELFLAAAHYSSDVPITDFPSHGSYIMAAIPGLFFIFIPDEGVQ